MPTVSVNFVTKARPAWIAGIILGVILLVIGIAASITILDIAGVIVVLLSALFLYASYQTKGVSD